MGSKSGKTVEAAPPDREATHLKPTEVEEANAKAKKSEARVRDTPRKRQGATVGETM